MEGDGHAEVLFRLPLWIAQPMIAALLDHEHAAAAGFFHEAAQVEHMGDIRVSENGESAS